MSYDLHLPPTIDEAVDLLARHRGDAIALAGGTALVLRLADGSVRARNVVGLRRIAALRGIDRGPDGSLVLRALVTHREAETSPLVRAHCPALADAFASVATVRIREQATVGGSVVHLDPAHDPPPMLIALDARVVIAGPQGEREVALEGLHEGASALRPGEIVRAVVVPPLARGARAAFIKYLPDTRYGYGTVSVAAVADLDDAGACRSARIVIGGCGATALRARGAEQALAGRRLDPASTGEAAALAAAEMRPTWDLRGSPAYKRAMARVWTGRALARIAA